MYSTPASPLSFCISYSLSFSLYFLTFALTLSLSTGGSDVLESPGGQSDGRRTGSTLDWASVHSQTFSHQFYFHQPQLNMLVASKHSHTYICVDIHINTLETTCMCLPSNFKFIYAIHYLYIQFSPQVIHQIYCIYIVYKQR